MEFGLLGPLVVMRDGQPVDVGGAKQRALLALLLVNANQVVSSDAIVEELWGDDGTDRQNALWVVVSRLRSALEPDRPKRTDGNLLLTQPPGYLIAVDPSQLDTMLFERRAAEGRSLLDPSSSARVLGDALALWRGEPLADFEYAAFARSEIERLNELRLATMEDRIAAELRRGRSHELVAELVHLLARHPLRQRAAGQLMLALHRSGRQSDALATYQALRTRLGDDLGLTPSSELAELERLIVCDDPSLRSASPSAGGRDAASSDRVQLTVDDERGERRRLGQLVVAGCVTILLALVATVGVTRWRTSDGLGRASLAGNLVFASGQARSLGDPELALLYAVAAIRATAPSGVATTAAVDATHWALQELGVQYDAGPEMPVAVRPGPLGPTGVHALPVAELVAFAEGSVARVLTDSECSEFWPDSGTCPPATAISDEVAVAGYDPPVDARRALAGTSVTLANFALTPDAGLVAELAAFTERTGIEVRLAEHTTAEDLARMFAGDIPRPDLFAATGPLVPEWAAARAIDLGGFLDQDTLRSDFGDYLLARPMSPPGAAAPERGEAPSAIPIDLDVKGLVFYPRAAFETAGYDVPADWDGLIALSEQMVADGRTPWCSGFFAGGPFDGWPATDLLDSLVVRTGGVDAFDAWVTGSAGFTSPDVEQAGRLADRLVHTPGFVHGGARSLSTSNFADDLIHLLQRNPATGDADPDCWLLHQGYFMFGLAGPGTAIGSDLDAFLLPPIDARVPPPLVVNGTFATGLVDRPEVRALLAHMASPEWGRIWSAMPRNGFLPANRRFELDPDAVAPTTDGEPMRVAARLISEAIADDRLRLDGSGMMPPSIGLIADGKPGAFFRGMIDWVDGRRTLDEVFADIDSEWATLRDDE